MAISSLDAFNYLTTPGAAPDPSVRRNLWQYTEQVGSSRYAVSTAAAKYSETQIIRADDQDIVLTRCTTSGFYGSLRSQVSGLGLTPFTAGELYLLSYYIAGAAGESLFVSNYMTNASTSGHNGRLNTSRPRRIWTLAMATDSSHLDFGYAATDDFGEGSGTDAYWYFRAGFALETDTREFYIGGFQIDHLSDSSYRDGVAWIGDSTMAGSSGSSDRPDSLEVSRWVGALLNVSCFNRAVGGEKNCRHGRAVGDRHHASCAALQVCSHSGWG